MVDTTILTRLTDKFVRKFHRHWHLSLLLKSHDLIPSLAPWYHIHAIWFVIAVLTLEIAAFGTYWIATATDEIVVSKTSALGSIGIYRSQG